MLSSYPLPIGTIEHSFKPFALLIMHLNLKYLYFLHIKLDEQRAMTAAHCLEGRYPNMTFRVVVGCSDRGIDGEGSDREDTVNVVGAVWVCINL